MSLRSDPIGRVPEETARVARAVFRKGNLCLRLRKALGTIYEDEKHFGHAVPGVQALKAPIRRRFARLACVAPALSGCRRQLFPISSLLPPSI